MAFSWNMEVLHFLDPLLDLMFTKLLKRVEILSRISYFPHECMHNYLPSSYCFIWIWNGKEAAAKAKALRKKGHITGNYLGLK